MSTYSTRTGRDSHVVLFLFCASVVLQRTEMYEERKQPKREDMYF